LDVIDILIDTPFNKRHHCWFCGEPSAVKFIFPTDAVMVIDCPHPVLSIPSCAECASFAKNAQGNSIWRINRLVKRALVKKYHKDLAIGINWTKQELANSQFEGGNFEGFQKSAWFMYEVAQARVNYIGCSISINGSELEVIDESSCFIFDGVSYPSLEDAINHYVINFGLNKELFSLVLFKMGEQKFSQAVRFCRLQIGATPAERSFALQETFPD